MDRHRPNLSNVTLAATDGGVLQIDLSRANAVKSKYRAVRAKFSRNDHRIRKVIYAKYGRKERDRVQQFLHRASKTIVGEAKAKHYGIALERLRSIRRLYRKGNGQSRNYRARMNSWSFAELQRQIEYKARWGGLPVRYVNPAGTSVKCSKCGCRVKAKPEENRLSTCQSCGFTVDRDVNAARNILIRALRFGAVGPACEAMVQEHGPPCEPSILKVDMGQSRDQPKT